MDKLTSFPTASSQCHVCNLCYEDRTKNRFPSLRCFFGFVFFWGESNQSWTGSNPPIPLDHYSPLGLKFKAFPTAISWSGLWKKSHWLYHESLVLVRLLLVFFHRCNSPDLHSTHQTAQTIKILSRNASSVELNRCSYLKETHTYTHTLLFLGKQECHLTKWILGALVSKDNWSLTDISDSVAHLLKVSQANSLNAKVKSLKTESSVARW